MRKLSIVVIALLIVEVAVASDSFTNGAYLGAQLGWDNMHYVGSDYVLPSNSIDGNRVGGRVYVGYYFSQFIAAELGYVYYGSPQIKYNPTGSEQTFIQQGIDFAAKFMVPLNYGFGIFGKLGLDWVYRSAVSSKDGYFAAKDANGKFAPAVGLGFSYTFNSHWLTDLSWKRTFYNGNLPRADFYALGLTYRFTNF